MARSPSGPVLGFHGLTPLGLFANLLAQPGLLEWLLSVGPLRIATVAVGLALSLGLRLVGETAATVTVGRVASAGW